MIRFSLRIGNFHRCNPFWLVVSYGFLPPANFDPLQVCSQERSLRSAVLITLSFRNRTPAV